MTPLVTSTRDRLTLQFGLLAVCSIVAVGKGFPALRRFEANRIAAANESTRELATLRAAASGAAGIRDSLSARQRRLSVLHDAVYVATSPQLAAAALAAELTSFATDCDARVDATVLRADSAFRGGIAAVAVRLSMAADVYGLAGLLEMIESGDRILSVRELIVSNRDPGGAESRPESLAIELLVEARAVEARAPVQGRKREPHKARDPTDDETRP
ncbi:MAG TPA: GspMb/PilO family protein [Gemmatimonadaceae bacterium]|nr:GspMb/PilO family protein [Gemmatimonadaceae bacterium]